MRNEISIFPDLKEKVTIFTLSLKWSKTNHIFLTSTLLHSTLLYSTFPRKQRIVMNKIKLNFQGRLQRLLHRRVQERALPCHQPLVD